MTLFIGMTTQSETVKISGIYKIINKANGKYYIGSSNHIHKRWKYHKLDLLKGNHHTPHLQRSWDKYGEQNFDFVIVEECLPEQLLDVEQKYLTQVKNNKSQCYNTSFIAGKIEMTEETKRKISLSSLGKKLSDETKEKLRQCNLGKKLSEETKRLISINNAKTGAGKHWNHTEETKKKISEKLKGKYIGPLSSMFGKHHTEEWKKKRSLLCKGKNHPSLNKTIYRFMNEKTNEVFEGIPFDFYTKYNVSKGNLANVINGTRKSVNGWKLVAPVGIEPTSTL